MSFPRTKTRTPRPQTKMDFINQGHKHYQRCAFNKAEKAFQKAIKAKPSDPHAHMNLAFVKLLNGDYERGFQEFDWRLKIEPWASFISNIPMPSWNGETLDGKTILLYTEQGAGDAIQSVRFAKDISDRGASVLVATQPHLKSLFEYVEGISKVLVDGDNASFDYIAPLFSMPKQLGISAGTIPQTKAYIAPPKLGGSLGQEMESCTRLKIGFVWAGNPAHINDKNRSIPLHKFKKVFNGVDAELFSFQIPLSSADQKVLQSMNIRDLSANLKTFLHTATIMNEMDLMICVDTSVAHLAGALGKTTWTQVPFAPDWRWMLEREDTPWYPNMKLFRQSRYGDWRTTLQDVNGQLHNFLNEWKCP